MSYELGEVLVSGFWLMHICQLVEKARKDLPPTPS